MDYTRFINNISTNETYHGKFLLHYVDSKTLNEELRLYRFADFIKIAREDLKKYENFELKNNMLYNFQLYIHAPDKEKLKQNIRQHSTTMTILYRIIGGHDISIKKGEKIKVLTYDHTRFDSDLKIRSAYITVKNPAELFKFKENDIIRVLENTGRIKTLIIVKNYHVPYFNFATNNIVPTDKWKIPKELQTSTHHSVSYIVNNNLFYKFPDDARNQFINFAVYIYSSNEFTKSNKLNELYKSESINIHSENKNAVYHKCMLDPELSKNLEHYNGKCCIGSKYTILNCETKSIIENLNINLKTINHYYLNEDFSKYNLDKYPSMKELKKICGIQHHLRSTFMDQNIVLTKYINSLTEKSIKIIRI